MGKKGKEEGYEFGGPVGAGIIMVISHFIPYYFWYCIEENNSDLTTSVSLDFFFKNALPNYESVAFYLSFIAIQAFLSWSIPWIKVYGLPLKGGVKLAYNINAIPCWYLSLLLLSFLHISGIYSLSRICDNYGRILTTATIFADFVAVMTFILAHVFNKAVRMSGNLIYDFFMGAPLNPRILSLDLKMFSEARVSWILLFLLTISCACKQYDEFGYVSASMIFMICAHGLYVNAIMKGEECIPTTWDIFYEKWGWMLIFWNLAGVPFTYCLQSYYILKNGSLSEHSTLFYVFIFIFLFSAYYVWDTSQSQRNRFRAMWNNSFVKRWAFPQFSYGTLPKECRYIQTEVGSKLLIDGWWGYCRKIHYTADICMALSWGLICGRNHFLPYFYVVFFTCMIIHRACRDISRCRKKYKADWELYCLKVPYLFIPYVF